MSFSPTLEAPRARAKPAPPELVPFTLPHWRAWAAGLVLDTGAPWSPEPFQDAFVADLFAGTPECWLVVPEGNGKTTLVAGLALYHVEFRPFAYVAVAASSRDQAQVLYAQAEGFVLRSPRLHERVHSPIQEARGKQKLQVPRFNPLPGYRRVDHHEGGRIQVYAADDATGDGLIPTLAILDELHRHRDLRLYRTWAGKLGKRNGQIVAISTAGVPGSEFELTRTKIRQGATAARKGSFVRASSKRLVLHEWAVPPKGDVEDIRLVKSANPFSGITTEFLRDKRSSDTMTLEHWQRFVCNVPTRGSNAAIQEAEWAAAATTDAIPAGVPIWAGLDVAFKWDTTALVPLWMRDREYRLFGPATILVPPRDGTSLDHNLIQRAVMELHERNPIETLVMDVSGAEWLMQWIENETGATVYDRSQTNQWASEDYSRFMEALRGGWLHHAGDQGLTSHVLNAIARILPLGDARFDRPAETRNTSMQDRRVVDALTAAAMVHGIAAIQSEPELEPLVAMA